jgi:hypothetical protein
MRLRWTPWLLVAAVALPALPASAGMPVPATAKCPVGGKSFTYTTTASYSIWGYRPDGKPYGSWEFPLEMPKCPGNGLVIFDRFSEDEIKRLKALVESPEYRAMRNSETSYFLAAWLMKELGRPPINVAWMTVQASWQADGRPELKKRYQELYVDQIRALPKSGEGVDWLLMQARAVNGLRELGRFDEARALLASLDLKPLDVPIPEERSEPVPGSIARKMLNYDEVREAKRKRAFLNQFKELGALIEARNSESEPLHMIPMREAAERCRNGADSLSQADRDYCASEDMKKLMERPAR